MKRFIAFLALMSGAVRAETAADQVDCYNCTVLFTALKHVKVPAELHLYPHGGHGYGLRPTGLPVTRWPARVAEWLQNMAFNQKTAP